MLLYLRITISALCVLICLPLIVMWVRSYQYCDSNYPQAGHRFTSLRGVLFIDDEFLVKPVPGATPDPISALQPMRGIISFPLSDYELVPRRVGTVIPYSIPTLIL